MNDGRAAVRRTPDRRAIEQFITIGAIKPSDFVAEPLEMSGDRTADVPTMPRDQNPHRSIITCRPALAPIGLAPVVLTNRPPLITARSVCGEWVDS